MTFNKMQEITRAFVKMYLFFLGTWIFGLILAYFWGMGWFLLVGAVRRVLVYFPPLRRRFRSLFLKEELPPDANSGLPLFSNALATFNLIAWTVFTIVVFIKWNIPLYKIVELFIP